MINLKYYLVSTHVAPKKRSSYKGLGIYIFILKMVSPDNAGIRNLLEYERKKKKTGMEYKMTASDLPGRDVFYSLKSDSLADIKDILSWANKNGLRTNVTMLDVRVSFARIKSDKDFEEVFDLINETSNFRLILRKNMNLFDILSDEKIINDILEIGIRGIDADSKEYFIMIYLEKNFLEKLKKRYELKEIR